MSKKLLVGAALSVCAATAFSYGAFAEEQTITTFDELKNCVESTEPAICNITADINIASPLTSTSNITINLNSHTIGVDATEFTTKLDNGMITINHGSTLTINGEGTITTGETKVFSPLRLTAVDDLDDSKKAIINVNNATLKGYYYGIVGSGNEGRGNTEVNLHGATIKGLNTGDCFGIYQPQLGNLNIYDGTTISGDAGIIMKSGNLNVYGGKIIGEGTLKETVPYGNGANSTGAALQIESNDKYSDNMHIRITGGEFISKNGYAIDEYKESSSTTATVQSVSIEGGTFTGKTLTGVNDSVIRKQSDNLGKFIKGGSFAYIDKIDTFISSYVETNKSYTYKDGYLSIHTKVQPKENTLPEDHTLDIEHTDHSQISEEAQAIIKEKLKAQLELPENFKFTQEEDITIFNGDGNEVTELDNAVEFSIVLENVPTVAEGYTRKWYIIRTHSYDGTNETFEFIDCAYDEASNTLSFGSKLFSAFIVGYADEKIPEDPIIPKAPDSGIVKEYAASSSLLSYLTFLPLAFYIIKRSHR